MNVRQSRICWLIVPVLLWVSEQRSMGHENFSVPHNSNVAVVGNR